LTTQIHFPPYLETNLPDSSSCLGTSINLVPLSLPVPQYPWLSAVTLQSSYSPTWTGIWADGSTLPSASITQSGAYVYSISNECYTASDTAQINFYVCEITVPNIISLSSLSGNNLFSVNSNGIEAFHCVIINRWGNFIYEYNDPTGSWNGKDQNGDLVNEGTYFYLIDATTEGGKEISLHGFVVVHY
jgi:hypothetical protein